MAKAQPASSRKKKDPPQEPICGFTFDNQTCKKRGNHLCQPRALKVKSFFGEVLVHTKGRFARKPFTLARWQWLGIIRPIFGTVRWDPELQLYVRVYRLAWIELARKNGKSEILAGIALYLVMGDDEEGAEIYGAAKDVKQARKVWDPAYDMVRLSPVLNDLWKRGVIIVNRQEKKIIYEPLRSYYEVITADAEGELGHNPHGGIIDEVLTQRDGGLYGALRTAMGTRTQPILVLATTADDKSTSFCSQMHKEMEKVAEDPDRAAHIFVYMRNTPQNADPWNERNWKIANPALGDFLSVQALRDEALEARNDPTKENEFRQFRLNQYVQQTTRYMPLHLWDKSAGEIAANPEWLDEKLKPYVAWAGLDLSSKFDLTSWALIFPFSDDEVWVRWRYWIPESGLAIISEHTAGLAEQWAKDGWLTVTEGDVIDFEQVYSDIEADNDTFTIKDGTFDPWAGEPVRQEIERRTGLQLFEQRQGFALSPAMHELMTLVKGNGFHHAGNPVSRWNADSVEVKKKSDNPDLIMPVKPDRDKSGARIDGWVASVLGLDGWMRRGRQPERRSVYEDRGLEVV